MDSPPMLTLKPPACVVSTPSRITAPAATATSIHFDVFPFDMIHLPFTF